MDNFVGYSFPSYDDFLGGDYEEQGMDPVFLPDIDVVAEPVAERTVEAIEADLEAVDAQMVKLEDELFDAKQREQEREERARIAKLEAARLAKLEAVEAGVFLVMNGREVEILQAICEVDLDVPDVVSAWNREVTRDEVCAFLQHLRQSMQDDGVVAKVRQVAGV